MKILRAPVGMLAGCFLLSCGTKPADVPGSPEKIHTTYRILAGVSMGGIGTAALGFQHPERFDGLAVQGGPLDAAFFFRMLDKFTIGGSCSRVELEKILAANPAKLNDPDEIARCRVPTPTLQWEHQQDFNHWHYTTNGADFNRDSYLNMITDISLGFGNLFTENPLSPFAPPSVDVESARNPPSDFCSKPTRVKRRRRRIAPAPPISPKLAGNAG